MSPSEHPLAVDPSPFDLRAAGKGERERGVALCLHGLTGTPYEMRPLARAIVDRGIRARGPLLPGHNSTPEALRLLPGDAWVSAVRDEYRRLREQHERVFLVGLSLGALLCLHLAMDETVDALVVVGAPLRFRQPLPLLIPLIKHVYPMLTKKTGSDIRDPEARSRHPGYPRMPLHSVHELIRLQRRVRAGLDRIAAPTLVAHGAHDSTADPRDARQIHGRIASSSKQVMIFAQSGHVVPVDYDGPELAKATADFLVRWL